MELKFWDSVICVHLSFSGNIAEKIETFREDVLMITEYLDFIFWGVKELKCCIEVYLTYFQGGFWESNFAFYLNFQEWLDLIYIMITL